MVVNEGGKGERKEGRKEGRKAVGIVRNLL
jgi:hypothetical protein